MDLFTTLLLAALGSIAVGSFAAIIIQIGKMFLPKVFPDGSAANWTLLICVLITAFVCFAPLFGFTVTFADAEKFLMAMSTLSGLLMPLLTWLATLIAPKFYSTLLIGKPLIGKSYSLDAVK